jgi:HlyD family secretion protein
MGKKGKLAVAAAAIIVVAGASIFAAVRGRNKGTEVLLEPVQRRDLEAIVSGNGYIRPRRRVDIQSDIMGRIVELGVAEGQRVSRGQLLLRIDPTQLEAAVQRATAAVSEAQAREAQASANLLQAERALERTRALAANGPESLVSRQALEEAETEVKVQQQMLAMARFGVAQARGTLDEARDRVTKTIIRSPMDGVITRLNVDEGETAIVGTTNNPGSLLMTVADLSVMEAVIRVDETDLPDLSIGDSAAVRIDAFPRQTFVGRVTEIAHSSTRPPTSQNAAQTQAQAVDFEIVITLGDPPAGLRSDLSTSADVVTAVRPGVLAIPIIALTVRERDSTVAVPQEDPAAQAAADAARASLDLEGVFVVRDGKAHFVPVQVGISGKEYFELISGLTEQDSVIAGPYDAVRSLAEGDPVRRMMESEEARAGAARAQGS